ncbi:MAG: hypothetical protein BGO49_23760 [Planctomycetales bacterium 71-10]|nr:MAG: hypothetical protein BGO49_23760 [Planctomycetales bacterium 71-10]
MAMACVLCGRDLGNEVDGAGRLVRCPNCGAEQRVRGADPAGSAGDVADVYDLNDEPTAILSPTVRLLPTRLRTTSRASDLAGPVAPQAPSPDSTPTGSFQPSPDSTPTGDHDATTSRDDDRTVSYVGMRADGKLDLRVADPADPRLVPFAPGAVLQDRYELVQVLGRGGMGLVFLGMDRRLRRSVAIKVMLPGRRHRSPAEQELMERLFTAEARLGASLNHPAIAAVYDFGLHGGRPYTVFEYVPGQSLRDFLAKRGGRLPLDEALLFLAPIAQALDFAHARRVVHRDLKPDNIRVTPEGQFKILDLGLAKEFDREQDWRFAGTPAYAAPEQCAELPPDGRTDQYALGVIVYEMLLGRRPFLSRDPSELLEMHRKAAPTPPRKVMAGIVPRVEKALMQTLEKDPNRRFASCEAFAREMGCQYVSDAVEAPEVLLQAALKARASGFEFVTGKEYWLLTPSDLWSCYEDEVTRWPLGSIQSAEPIDFGRSIRVEYRGESWVETVDMRFNSWRRSKPWKAKFEELLGDRTEAVPGAKGGIQAKDVIVIRDRPNVGYQVLGPVEVRLKGAKATEAALKMVASGMDAEAVVDVQSRRVPMFDRTVRVMSGTAVRTRDAAGRREMRRLWFDQETGRVGKLMLVMLAIFAVLSVVSAAIIVGLERSRDPGSDATFAKVYGTRLLLGAWPLVMACCLRWLRWPQMVRAASWSFLTLGAATHVGLIVGGLASMPSQASLGFIFGWLVALIDPFGLAILVIMLHAAGRARHAYDRYSRLMSRKGSPEPDRTRVVAVRLAEAVSKVYMVCLPAYLAFQFWWGATAH